MLNNENNYVFIYIYDLSQSTIVYTQKIFLSILIDSYCIYIICIIFMFLQCVSTVIIVYIITSPLNSYLYIHWILDFK